MARTSEETRKSVDAVFTNVLDQQLTTIVSGSLGASVDVVKTATMIAGLKLSLRSKISATLGLTGSLQAGSTIFAGVNSGAATSVSLGAGASSTYRLNAGLVGGLSGAVGGVAGGALSFGAGLGTRASRPNKLVGNVNFGTSLAASGSFGVGSQAGFGQKKSGIKPSAGGSISAGIMQSFTAALGSEGYSFSEIREITKTIGDAVETTTQQTVNSSFGPELGYPNARGAILISADVTMKTHGVWFAWVEIDFKESDVENDDINQTKDYSAPTGPFVFEIDGVEYRGTAVPMRAGEYAGSRKIKVVGGAGGFTKTIQARNYAGGLVKVKTIVDDILRDCGEILSEEADTELLNKKLPAWHRAQAPGGYSLDILCQKLKCEWRVLRDGTVWIGFDEWPSIIPAGTLLKDLHAEGHAQYSMEFATVVPGVVVNEKKVEQVSYTLNKKGLNAEFYSESTSTLISRQSEKLDYKTEFTRRYRCKVVRQNGDGTVDVLIDDERIDEKRGVGKCRVKTGYPGSTLKVGAGSRCIIGWDDGDPSLPYVSDWEMGTPGMYTQFGTNNRGAAYSGAPIECLLPTLMPFQGTINGLPSTGVITVVDKAVGVVSVGYAGLRF